MSEKSAGNRSLADDAHSLNDSNSAQEMAESLGVNEKALLRRIDYKLLPALSFLYLLSFLDRSNVGNARIEGLTTDLKITGDQYLTGLTLFFIGYVIVEVPCNIILKRWTPQLWLPTLTLVWGIVSTLQGVIVNRAGFWAVRFFLGVAEAGLFPGIVFYLSMWYQRNERQYRIALFFSAAALAGSFGGILAYGIAHMNGIGGYHGWRWIFIIEGLLTIVIGVTAYFFIYNYPSTASFLSEKERSVVHARLETDSDAVEKEAFNWHNVRKAFLDPKVYLYCFAYHTMSLPLYTLSLFLPTIIKSLGYTSAQAQLLTIPPYAFAFLTTLTSAILSQKYRRRAPFIICTSAFAMIGYIILLTDYTAGISYLAIFFAAGGIYPSVALVLAWPANNVAGQTKRAVANAMQIMIGNLGAVIGTQLYRTEDSPRYYLGHGFALGYLGANIVIVSTLWLVLSNINKKREQMFAELRDAKSDQHSRSDRGLSNDDDLRWMFYL